MFLWAAAAEVTGTKKLKESELEEVDLVGAGYLYSEIYFKKGELKEELNKRSKGKCKKNVKCN